MKFKAIWSLAGAMLISALIGLNPINSALAQQDDPNQDEGIQLATAMVKELSQAPDPDAAYENLSPEDKKTIEDNLFLHSTTVNVGPAVNLNTGATLTDAESSELASLKNGQEVPYARFSGCWSVPSDGFGTNVLGVKLFTYGQTTQVCVKRNRVRSVRVTDTWSRFHLYGWRVGKNPTTATKNVG